MKELSDATSGGPASAEQIDRLVWTSVFGKDAEVRGVARFTVRTLAANAGIRPASIHDLYMAMGRGEASGFTVPAINVRAMSYDTARAVIRAARKLNAGAFIFEIARSEMGYTEQRPDEYAAVVLGAALREGFTGPIFIQGDHVQTNAKKYNSPERDKELDGLRELIKEEIAAGFYNIDIDTSTLVDLDRPTLDEQQEVNVNLAAEFAAFIRSHEPKRRDRLGGRRDRRGWRQELRRPRAARLHEGVRRRAQEARQRPGRPQQDQRPDRHRARRLHQRRRHAADGREDRSQDARGAVRVARTDYGMGGAVQHGASTLPAEAFDEFPKAGACEIHLATDFQNMVYEHPQFPADLKAEMYTWVRANATEERKPKDTEEQFIYKARKKAIGPFKQQMWSLPEEARRAIGQSLEDQFTFLMTKLKINDTAATVAKFVKVPAIALDRGAEISPPAGRSRRPRKKQRDWRTDGGIADF